MKTRLTIFPADSRFNRMSRCFGLAAVALLLGGCPSSSSKVESSTRADDGKIIIKGSNTVGEELAPKLIAAYKESNPKAEFELETKGTSYGMGALMGGMCDIAGASRPPLKEELEVAEFRNVELADHVIGAYSIAVIINAANPVTGLTKDQVRDIFTGTITNWKDVGGPDAAIKLYIRDPISGTYLGFKELAMENKVYADSHHLYTNYAGIVDAVANDPQGIGYSSIDLLSNNRIKGMPIGGVEPTYATVNKGEYPYARMLHLYTSKGRETKAAMDFIEYVLSSKGQDTLTKAGYVPKS